LAGLVRAYYGNTSIVTGLFLTLTKFRTLLLLGMAGAVAGAAVAQEAPQAGTTGPIIIPENVTMLGKDDPNVRRATAVVNGEIITGTDVDQRVALILAANDNKASPEELQRLKLQVLRNLIDESLQIQEAKSEEIEIEDAEVNQTYTRVAAQNFRQDTKAMDAYLSKIGSSPASLKRQIRGELAWQQLLRRKVSPNVNVSDEEVRAIMKRLEEAKGTEEFRIGEIFLSANSENRDAVFENAKKIVEQLRQGGSFVAYARQFSEASTASRGGDLGWVRLAMLPPEMATAVRELGPGQLVGPVEIRGGFTVVFLIDKRAVLMADPRDALLSLKQIKIAFAPGTREADATKRAGEFATAMKNAGGCGRVDSIAAQFAAEVVTNDQVKARDLPGPLQDSLLALSLGETSPPFGSIEQGVSVLMLCGRDDPQVAGGPNFDEIMSQLEDDRVNKRAQLYLRDLRRDAVIDYN
jgi:peptidyl-prolyl cis-trans isomerase SurA